MKHIYLGMDIGTTNTKVLAIDEFGDQIAIASNETVWHNKPGGRVEANPEEIFRTCLQTTYDAIKLSKAIHGEVKVASFAITGLAESGVIVDSQGLALSNPVAWFDARGEKEMHELGEEFRIGFQSKTGLVFKAEASISTLLSLKSEGFDFTNKDIIWLNLQEYIAYRLTGTMASEPSLSSRTGLYDQSTFKMWKGAKDVLGVNDSFVPEERNAGESWGEISSPFFESELIGAVVTIAGHDHAVGALGSGATQPDQIFNSTGTSDAILRTVPGNLTDQQRIDLTTMGVSAGRHVLANMSGCIGGSRGGLILRRSLDLIGARRGERLREIDEAWSPKIKFRDVIDLTQHKSISNDISIVVTGDAGPNELWAAALDYMAGENKKFLAGLDKVVGKHKSSVAAGGWIKMSSVREVKKTVMTNLEFSNVEEAGATGAAYIASWIGQKKGDTMVDHINARVLNYSKKNRSSTLASK
jgi:sugar (pentulose or hexulose) kinase